MGPEETSILQSGVWLIPLFLLATIFGLYLLVRYWQSKTQTDVKQLRSELRNLDTTFRQSVLAAQMHSKDDPEPYGSRAAALHAHLAHTEGQIDALQRQYIALQEQIRWLSFNNWQAMVGAPYYWYQLRRDIAAFWAEMTQTQQSLQTASQFEYALNQVGWEVALKARQARQTQLQAKQLMDGLRSRGMQGQAIETAGRLEQQAMANLARVPAHFFDEDETGVLDQADKNGITSAYENVEAAQQDLGQVLAQAQAWERQYDETSQQLATMQRTLASVESLLANSPAALDIAPLRTQFGQLQVIAQNLQATLGRLEIESIPAVLQETAHVTQIAEEMGGQLQKAYADLAAMEKAQVELQAGLKQISMQCAALGTQTNSPIVWGQTTTMLSDLNRQASAIGSATLLRDPLKLEQDLVRLNKLNERQRSLAGHCEQIEVQHTELVRLLESPELSQVHTWLKSAHQLTARVKQYAPENWSRTDAVASLPDELGDLEKDAQRLVPSTGSQSIPEAEVTQRLDETRKLAEACQKLQKRATNIQARLAGIQKDEKQAHEQLVGAQAALTQVAYVVSSNSFLSKAVAQELKRLQDEVQAVLKDLADRQRGNVEKKARQASALVARAEQAINNWLDQINQGIQACIQQLSTSLTALDAIAPLDDEPAVAEARRQLAASQAHGVSGFSAKSRFSLEAAIAEFKPRSTYWQSCQAAANALQDAGGAVLESYQQAKESREAAQQSLSETTAWLRQWRDWPPTSVTMDDERKEMENLDSQWGMLKSSHLKAIQLVQQLATLAGKYQALAEKTQHNTDRATQEMAQVEDMENELNELAQQWENQSYAYRDEPQVSQEIRALLDEIDHEMEQLRRQYKRRARDYNQIVGQLKSLQRKVRYYQVALDADHAIDATGNVHRRR